MTPIQFLKRRRTFVLVTCFCAALFVLLIFSGERERQTYGPDGQPTNQFSPVQRFRRMLSIGWSSGRQSEKVSDLFAANVYHNVCYAIGNFSHLQPIDNFRYYPCLNGLPVYPNENWSKEVKCARTFCYPLYKNITDDGCVLLKTLRGRTPICTYPAKSDVYVSRFLQKYGQWEGPLVNRLARFVRATPGTEFLDLGCNIGTYSLSMAHLGIKVTAVDPLLENLKLLSHSLKLGHLQQNVTLIWNAVSNRHTLITFQADRKNIGGMRIKPLNESNTQNNVSYHASAITLNDLIPLFRGKRLAIKMDIEESEYFALLGGNHFLEEIDIAAIQMEFLFHKTGKYGKRIFSYLESKGFDPFEDLDGRIPLKTRKFHMWPNDVYFMKKKST